eukprot:GFUD01013870.1.p1 GENE.GFUD01013870.1~~GFUD01013870.1.p1  ORF type:complete len:1486 (+),score=342.48 GFUD01013870.1:534-4991(+)
MTRKKQQKSKKSNPGVFISSLLGAKSEESKNSESKQELRGDKVDIHRNSEAPQSRDACLTECSEVKTVISQYQEVVLLRTVVELALVNLALGDQQQGQKHSAQGPIHPGNVMAPPVKEGAAGSGLSKLMNPVQDLGRSLLGFLIGSPQPSECAPPPIPARGSSLMNNKDPQGSKRDSIVSTASITSPGRQRPLGHPAHPSINSTPVVIRRTKTDRGVNMSRSMESQDSHILPAFLNTDSVKDYPENMHVNRQSVHLTPTCSPPVSTCVSPEPRPPSSKSRRKRSKKNAQERKEHDTGNKKVSSPEQTSQPQTEPTIPDLVPQLQAKSTQSCNTQNTANANQKETVSKQKVDKKTKNQNSSTGANKTTSTSQEADRSSPVSRGNDNEDVSEPVCLGEKFNAIQEARLKEQHEPLIIDGTAVDTEPCASIHATKSEDIHKTDDSPCSSVSTEEVILRRNLSKHLHNNRETRVYEGIEDNAEYVTARNSIIITGSCNAEQSHDNVDQFYESESEVKEVAGQLVGNDEIHPVDNVTKIVDHQPQTQCKNREKSETNHEKLSNTEEEFGDAQTEKKLTAINEVVDYPHPEVTCLNPLVENVLGNPEPKSGPELTQDESFPASSQIPAFSATDSNERETHAETCNKTDSAINPVKPVNSAGSSPPIPPPPPPDGFLTEGLKLPKIVTKVNQSKVEETKDTPQKTGTLKKNKQLSREEALLEQLSGLDDTFACFLKTQLSIKINPRERDGVNDTTQIDTLRRKKERRKRTESECSETAKEGTGSAIESDTIQIDNLKRKKETRKRTESECSDNVKEETGCAVEIPGSTQPTITESLTESGHGNQDSLGEQVAPKDLDKTVELQPEVTSSALKPETQLIPERIPSPQGCPEKPTKKPKSQLNNEISEKYSASRKSGSNASEVKVRRTASNSTDSRKRTGSNASEVGRDRPASYIELSESEPIVTKEPMSNIIYEEQLESTDVACKDSVIDNVDTTDNVDVTNNNVEVTTKSNSIAANVNNVEAVTELSSQQISTKTNFLLGDPRADPSSHDVSGTGVHDMTVGSNRATGDTLSPAMGAIHSSEKEIARQNLSKSDSGYSGHISVDSVDETDLEDHSKKRPELTVDQALLRYDRTVGKTAPEPPLAIPPVINRRTRVLSEGTEYSDELSDSELDASDVEDDDGVTRRARDTRSYNSRRSSTDSSEDGFNQNVRDLKQEVKDLEEKFRKAMVANASLDNEKCQLMFQVDLLKDQVEEGEEQAALVVKELRAKTHDYEILKRDHAESVRAVQLLQQALTEQQSMLQERGLVLLGEGEDGDGEDCDEVEQEKRTRAIVSQETANILAGLGSGPLDVRIKRLAGTRDDLQDTVRRLKLDLEEERSRSSLARGAASMDEIERETKKLLDDYKFKISKSDQEIATLGANVARLESQVIRYKTASETSELSEENLKAERRKMQRELRDAVTRNEELETQNKHLEKRLDKLKTAKSNLLKEL